MYCNELWNHEKRATRVTACHVLSASSSMIYIFLGNSYENKRVNVRAGCLFSNMLGTVYWFHKNEYFAKWLKWKKALNFYLKLFTWFSASLILITSNDNKSWSFNYLSKWIIRDDGIKGHGINHNTNLYTTWTPQWPFAFLLKQIRLNYWNNMCLINFGLVLCPTEFIMYNFQ